MKRNKLDSKKSFRNVWLTCLVAFLFFAFQHYLRRFGQPISDIYLTIINKSTALTSFTMISAAILTDSFVKIWPDKLSDKTHYVKSFGISGFILAYIHILISSMMFSSVYYPEYFTAEKKITAAFGISHLFGIIFFICFLAAGFIMLAKKSKITAAFKIPRLFGAVSFAGSAVINLKILSKKLGNYDAVRRINYIFYVFLLIHIFILKYRKLFNADNWVNGLPSGSLVAFTITLIVVLFWIISIFKSSKYKPGMGKR
ncbi:MAG: hypothetical protein A2231_12685 [Candidatus Firestonebacteria bacterium RIFOXYA2_FULL_40_8]|nr:MAG: hypothetical protein A2231_12685 [Candidatus Firestonebacteria bacterium RIFOXYA2_FULL_40_8]